jgi:hypothetical protein
MKKKFRIFGFLAALVAAVAVPGITAGAETLAETMADHVEKRANGEAEMARVVEDSRYNGGAPQSQELARQFRNLAADYRVLGNKFRKIDSADKQTPATTLFGLYMDVALAEGNLGKDFGPVLDILKTRTTYWYARRQFFLDNIDPDKALAAFVVAKNAESLQWHYLADSFFAFQAAWTEHGLACSYLGDQEKESVGCEKEDRYLASANEMNEKRQDAERQANQAAAVAKAYSR